MSVTTILAIYGALLSTGMFPFKVYEHRKNSFKRLKIQFHTDDHNKVNTLTIINFSTYPVNISYYDVFYAHKKKSEDKLHIDSGIEGDLINIHIEPSKKIDLVFNEAYYFNPTNDKFKGKTLFIKLWQTGKRKTITKRIM